MPIVSCFFTVKSMALCPLYSPCQQVFIHTDEVPLNLLFLRLKNASSQPLLIRQMLQTCHQLCSLLLDSIHYAHVSCTTTSVPRTGHRTPDVVSLLLSRGGTQVPTTICKISLSFTKASTPPKSGAVSTHFCPSPAPLADRRLTLNACDHLPSRGYRHLTELRQNEHYLLTHFT